MVFLSEERHVAQAVENGLSVPPDVFVNVSYLGTMAVKRTLSNIPPFFSSEEIVAVLSVFGTVVSRISMIPLRLRSDASVRHIMSFRRHCYIILKKQRSIAQCSHDFKKQKPQLPDLYCNGDHNLFYLW